MAFSLICSNSLRPTFANSALGFMANTSASSPLLHLPQSHLFSLRASTRVAFVSMSAHGSSYSQKGEVVLFHAGEGLKELGFCCFSRIWHIKPQRFSFRSYRKQRNYKVEAKQKSVLDTADRLSPFLRHALFCSSCSQVLISHKHKARCVSEASGVTESGLFSLSDDELSSRGFELLSSSEGIDLDQLNSLFVKVGFPRRQKEKLTRALQHTLSLFWLREIKSNQTIAFARATGDNVFNAIIWDVVVDPSYQGLGLGKAVMERLMADLVKRGISNIALYAESNVLGFYKPLGFISDPDGIKAMAYSRKRRQ